MTDEGEERDFINKKPRITQEHFGKGRILNGDASDFGQILNLQKRHGRNAPGTIAAEPGKCGEPGGAEHEPDHEVGVEQKRHAFLCLSGVIDPGGPCHSQPHSSARSASGACSTER